MKLETKREITIDEDESKEEIFEIIPAVNVFKDLSMIKGAEGYEPMLNKEGGELKVQELIDELTDRFDKAVIMDLNGINKDRPQLDMLKSISDKMKMWVDAGSKYSENVIDIIIAGADKVVFGSKTLRNLDEIEGALELSENVILGIDYDEGIVTPNKSIREMTPSGLVEMAGNFGIKEVIFTDLKNLTSNSRFRTDIGFTLLDREIKIYFHGRFENDMKKLEEKGVSGVIIEVETLL